MDLSLVSSLVLDRKQGPGKEGGERRKRKEIEKEGKVMGPTKAEWGDGMSPIKAGTGTPQGAFPLFLWPLGGPGHSRDTEQREISDSLCIFTQEDSSCTAWKAGERG